MNADYFLFKQNCKSFRLWKSYCSPAATKNISISIKLPKFLFILKQSKKGIQINMNSKILALAILTLAVVSANPAHRGKGRRFGGSRADRKGRFLEKFFDPTCQPTCAEGQHAFSLLTTSTTECPTDFSDRSALRGIFVKPRDFCAAEVSRFCSPWIKIVLRVAFSLLTTLTTDCPTDFSDKSALRGIFVKPRDFCAAEVSR